MSNEYFNSSGAPVQGSTITSPAVRAQFTNIETGFGKFPAMSTTASKIWATNSAGTAVEGTLGVSGTGTISIVAAKTLTVSDTTTIGTNSITLAGGEVITFTATNALTFTTTGATNVTLPTSGTLATTAGTIAKATNIAGGATGSIPYQSGTDVTTFLSSTGNSLKILSMNAGETAPTWITKVPSATLADTATLATTATTATNVAGGAAGSLHYQTGAATTAMLGVGTAGQVLRVNSGATAPEWATLITTAALYTTTGINKTLADREFCKPTVGGLTLTLPTATVGMEIYVYVPAGNVTTVLGRQSGENIMGSAANCTLNVAPRTYTLAYHNVTDGWIFK